MAKCPACRSKRVYKGYRPPPLFLRIFLIHEYLCEDCNLQFRAFSILPPRSRRRGKQGKSQAQRSSHTLEVAPALHIQEPVAAPQPTNNPLRAQTTSVATASVNPPPAPRPMPPPSEPPKPTIQGQWEMPAQALEELESRRHSHRSHQVCPSCGATDTQRRRRKMWEKAVFAFTDIRAYQCRICGEDFYARRKKKDDQQQA